MGYLITQIIVCLLIAGLIGFILGWLLRGLGCKDSEENEGIRSSSTLRTSGDSDSISSNLIDSSDQADDFYPEPVTKAPGSPRIIDGNRPIIDLSSSSSTSTEKSDAIGLSSRAEDLPPESEAKTSPSSHKIENIKTTIDTASTSSLTSEKKPDSTDSANQTDDFYPEPITKAPTISHRIEKIEGIGKSLGNKIRRVGVKNTKDLLQTCSTETGLQKVIEASKTTKETVTQWVSMADLMRVPGINGQIAELMLASGIKSTEMLTNTTSQVLTEEMLKVNNREKKIPSSIDLPSVSEIAEMIKEAKTL